MEMKLCRPKIGCSCAPGLKGILCDKECSEGKYGAGCRQKCGHCIDYTCDPYSGHCVTGCQEGYYPPYCQKSYKYLNTAPDVTSVDYDKLLVTFSTEPGVMSGNGNPAFYQLQIKDAENGPNTWKELEPISLPAAQNVSVNITDLKPGTSYKVRVVLLDIDGNSYQDVNIPVVNVYTKCI
ncbi:hypothetical protein L9F63_019667, partial [Diploptera punctata]